MVATLPPKRRDESSRRWIVASVGLALAVAVLAVGLLTSGATSVSAANAGVAPPLVEQCNDSGPLAGQELRCTIEVEQYLNADGTLASSPESTVTITICEAAESGGAVPCADPVTTVLLEPVTTARQCNFAYQGGDSWIECTVTIANHWVGDPTPTPATIFQCVGSPVTGEDAIACDPPVGDNTAPSTPEATVGQCNGSGGPGTPPDGFICTVHSSSTTAALPMHVDQCNDSGYGGGTVIRCTVTIMNSVIAAPAPTPEPTAVPTAEPTAEPTAVPTAEPTAAPAEPTATLAEPTAAPAEPTAAPAEPAAAPAEPTAAPAEPTAAPAEPTAAPAEPAAPTMAPTPAATPPAASPPAEPAPVPSANPVPAAVGPVPQPAETGSAGLVEHAGTSWFVSLLMDLTALGLLLGAGRFLSARRDR